MCVCVCVCVCVCGGGGGAWGTFTCRELIYPKEKSYLVLDS